LQLKLSHNIDINEKKYNYIENDVSKLNYKQGFEPNNELLLIYKLLSVKLKSLRIEQKLYEENSYLKILADKLNQFTLFRKQQLIWTINQSIENLPKTETYFTTKFELLFNKLHNNSNKEKLKQHLNTGTGIFYSLKAIQFYQVSSFSRLFE
jgi:hypothetical protein